MLVKRWGTPSGPFMAKSRMPCFSGIFPVTIVFQMRGDEIGIAERSGPDTPSLAIRVRFGSFRSLISSWTRRGDAPSIPIKIARPGSLVARVAASQPNRECGEGQPDDSESFPPHLATHLLASPLDPLSIASMSPAHPGGPNRGGRLARIAHRVAIALARSVALEDASAKSALRDFQVAIPDLSFMNPQGGLASVDGRVGRREAPL